MPEKGKTIAWGEIEDEYLNGQMTLKELAERRGISYDNLKKRASRYRWVDRRKQLEEQYSKNRLAHATELLLIKISQALEREDLDPKDYKALSSALKELEEVQEHLDTEATSQQEGIVVQLSKELEELSR
jgi:RecG-like helicase